MALDEFTSEQRVKTPCHHIDVGFINHRRIFTTFGRDFHKFYEDHRNKADDHQSRLWNDHLLTTYALDACRQSGVRTLGEVLNDPKVGDLFCSTELFRPCPDIYDEERVTSQIEPPFEAEWEVYANYSTSHIKADTCKMLLHEGGHKETIIAGIQSIKENVVTVHPLIIGAPSFDHPRNKDLGLDLMWYGWEWFEIHPEDIDEFNKLTSVVPHESGEWQDVMKNIPEEQVKASLAEILGDETKKDWGGEMNDHFASLAHLSGERVSAAFLLKGPAKFEEMTPRHLGKNADQIYRLACSPANLLIVQHAHAIGEAVRATLRAFAVNPANPRRYCFIDGRDTYRILSAYGKL